MSQAGQASEAGEAGETGGASAGSGLDEPPPFWSRWGRIYWVVAALLAAQTLLYWLLSRWAA